MAHRKDPEKKFTRELRKELSDRYMYALIAIIVLVAVIVILGLGITG